MTTKDIALIKKLNDQNFSNWSFKVEMLLLRDDLFKVVIVPIPENQQTTGLNKILKLCQ